MATFSMDWIGDLRFKSGEGEPPVELHSSTTGTLSPMQALAYAQMACMAMDVVYVLEKGRHDLKGLRVTFDGDRAPEPPRRYTSMHLHFDVTGNIDDTVIERAIELSRDKYCSVSNSLREDIDFKTTFAVKR
ncbi:MAG TPA: OsmC family protein [Vicinamibacterales bacterium]|nr:OsmC family protein [Vicinamibacterales bacterium]